MSKYARLNPLCAELYGGATPSFDDLHEAFVDALPLLGALRDTPQDPEWHAEGDVHIHSRMTLDELYQGLAREEAEWSVEDRAQLVLSCAFHDIAKALTTREQEIQGRMRITAPRHAERGRSYLAPLLINLGLPPREILEIISLVGHHHDPRRLVYKDRRRGDYWRLQRLVDLTKLNAVCLADLKGRITDTADQLIEDHHLFHLFLDEYSTGLYPHSSEWRDVIDEGVKGLSEVAQRFVHASGQREAELGLVSTPHEVIARSFQYRERFAQLHLVSGPSGLGKSTWIGKHHPDAIVISMDEVRRELTGSMTDQSQNRKVFQIAQARLKRLLMTSEKIVWDATNVREIHRDKLVSLAYRYRAFVRIDVLCAPLSVALTRNQGRDRHVPEAVIRSQYQRWEWVTADEAHEVGYWFLDDRDEWCLYG